MNRHLLILLKISDNENISQRELGRITGLSLGTINGIIQSMENDGLIKYQLTTLRQGKYFLTKKGIKTKARLLQKEAIDSYRFISMIKSKIKQIIEREVKDGIRTFYLIGTQNEVYKLLKMSLIEAKRNVPLKYIDINSLTEIRDNNYVLLIWEDDFIELNDNVNYMNILE